MTRQERYEGVLQWFEANNPAPASELQYANPYELLVAVILSAQCTDKRVNMVTPALFHAYPHPEKLALASPLEVRELIRSISYPNNKAHHLVGMAQKLVADFNGEVPSDLNDLRQLPGVGRKTANVVASVIFDQPAMAVDTHVFRVATRIGLTQNAKTPLAAERQLVENIPTAMIARAHHWLILHGRYICMARQPQCQKCQITTYCLYHQNQPTNE